MFFERIVLNLYSMLTWIMRMVYLNLLWIIFSLIGLLILGLFPATAAMFSVTRKWLLGDTETPIFKTFYQTYKTSFWQANFMGLILSIFGMFLYIDLRLIQMSDSVLLSMLAFLILFIFIIYFVVCLYVFPVFVHFKCKTIDYIKRALIIVIGKPLHTIMMIVSCYLIYAVVSIIPFLIIVSSGSMLSLALMWVAMLSFPKKVIEIEK